MEDAEALPLGQPYIRVAFAAAACAAAVSALILAAHTLSTPAPRPSPALPGGAPPRPRGPGRAWALQRPTTGGAPYWVLRDAPGWRRSRAADACHRAQLAHRLALDRHAAMPEAARSRAASAIGRLPDTARLVQWVQAPTGGRPGTVVYSPPPGAALRSAPMLLEQSGKHASKVVGGRAAPVYPDRRDPNWMKARGGIAFAYVDADALPAAARASVSRAIGSLFDTELQAEQVAALCDRK